MGDDRYEGPTFSGAFALGCQLIKQSFCFGSHLKASFNVDEAVAADVVVLTRGGGGQMELQKYIMVPNGL